MILGLDVPLGFGAPWWLGLLFLLALIFWLARGSLSGLSGPRRAASLALRVLVVLLLILALAEFRILKRNERLAVIFAVDRSESIPAAEREAARQLVLNAARERDRAREDMVGVVAFGKLAGIEQIPKKEPLELESFVTLIEPEATDIAAAVRLAVAAFPEKVGKRIVILSDGNENREAALDEVRVARSLGVTVDVVPIRYSYTKEISIDKLLVDPEMNLGQPFEVRVVVDSVAETEANLRLFENDRPIPQGEPRVKLRPGKNVFDFKMRLDLPGQYRYEARLEPARPEDDSIFRNNTAYGFTSVQGEPKVLLCASEPQLDRPLVSALLAEKIAVKEVLPEFLPRGVEEYLDYEAVIFSNVAAHQLSEDQMKMLETLVQTVGLGFVMIGGENSFGAGGYRGTPVERILPVDMDIKQRKVLPNGALAMVVHSCELGNGNYWARQVIQRAIQILSPRDYAGVLYYDGLSGEKWLFKMTPIAERRMMLGRLATFDPGDMMSFQTIMQMALSGLQGTGAHIKHMIILSDGDPAPPSPQLVSSIKAAQITISTICYGAHGVIPQAMKQLAQNGGGKFYELKNPDNLPEVFIREATTVQKSLISEERFLPAISQRGPILQGLEEGELPALDGYVITSPKELASLLLVRPPGGSDPVEDPVLAAWTFGLGKSVAFTSDAGRRWGKDWVAWKGYQRFWGQLIRWVSKTRSDDRFRILRTVEGEKGVVSVDAITPDGQFVNGLELKGKVTSPDFETLPVVAKQVAPGRYVLNFDANKKGTYLVALSYQKEGVPSTLVTGLSVPYSQEYRRLQTNQELLRLLAEAGGGKCYESPEKADFFSRDFPITRDVQDIWRWLLISAVVLFYLDVFVRRVVAFWTRKPRARAAAAADPRLAVLLERKAQLQRTTLQRGETVVRSSPAAAEKVAARTVLEEAISSSPKEPPAPAESTPEARETKAPEEESYTARLLEAKRRALRRDDGNKKEDS